MVFRTRALSLFKLKGFVLIFISFLFLGNNLLFTYTDLLFTQEKEHVCSLEVNTCCMIQDEQMEDCCNMEDCCMNIPAPAHFSFGVIIGAQLENNSQFVYSETNISSFLNNHSPSALSDGFLAKLYKPPAA